MANGCAKNVFNFLSGFIYLLCVIKSISSANGSGFSTIKLGPKPIWNATDTDRLRQDLLLNYDKFARPMQHYNTTTVSFGLSLTHFEINEFKSTITVHSWTRMRWEDGKFKWDPSEYGGLTYIHLADHEIWQPDIFLYNGPTASPVNSYGNTHCLLYNTGEILWVPPTQYTALCELNLLYWPFDTQECFLKFGSWTYNGDQIDLQTFGNDSTQSITDEFIIPSTEWELLSWKVERHDRYYSCCLESYPDITFTFTLKRRSPSYKALIVTPAFAIIMLTLMSFFLPPQAGEKIILNGCTAIIITIFMVYFTQKLPAMGSHTPLIVFFYSSSLYIACFTTASNIFVLWLSRSQHTKALPWIIKRPLMGWLGKWLGLSHMISQTNLNPHRTTAEEMRDHQVTDFEEHNTNDDHQMIGCTTKRPIQEDWILFAAAFDRIAFVFFSLLFAFLAIAYSL